ncbi:MAG: Crp/Fnr family transcriptional regulator [Acetobacteraceae bacterium]
MGLRPLDRFAKRELLRGTTLFAILQPTELEELLGFVTERRVEKGTAIMERGDAGSSMMVLATGRARVTAASTEGREVTFAILEPGMTFGELSLLDGKPRSATVSAMDDCLILVVERRDFLRFLRGNAELALRMLALLCERLRDTDIALEEIALMDFPSRLARLVLKLAHQYGESSPRGQRIRMKLSQTDLSTLVAATRESVNKQLRVWRDAGIIDEEGGYLVIRDVALLRAVAA